MKDKGKTRVMKPDSNQGSKPKVRFPEFEVAGDWEKKKLSDLLVETKTRNRDLKYGPNAVLSVSGEFGCVNQIEHLGRSYAGVSVKDYHIVETGDVVYTKSPLKRNPYGIIKANKGKPGIVSTLYAVYRTTELGLPDYLDHYFSRDHSLNSYLQPIVRKGAKNDMKVNNADVLSGYIWVPKRNEQRKLSACLTSLDELIAAHGRKLDALKSYKKGLMQQLFPRDGESIPRLRFPEFQVAGDWEKKKLSDLLVETKTRNRDLKYGPNAVLSVSGEFGCVNQIEHLGRSYAGVSVKDYHIVETDDVVYTKSPLKRNPYGIIKANKGKPGIVSTLYAVYRTTELGLPDYLDHYFSRDHSLNSYLQPIVRKGAKNDMKVNNADVLSGYIWVPKRNEQRKLSACLTSLDELIAAHGRKLDALKSYKKGLMQQLFPSAEDVEE